MDWPRYLVLALFSLALCLSNASSLLWGADLFGKPNCEEIASAIELLSQNELSLKDNKLYKEASLAIRNNKKILDKIN